jgi:hypothetical protein
MSSDPISRPPAIAPPNATFAILPWQYKQVGFIGVKRVGMKITIIIRNK